MYVTGKELSAVLGVSDRRIRQLVNEKVFERDSGDSSNKFHLPTCVQKFIEYKLRSKLGDKDIDYFQERSKHERAKRVKAEVELTHLLGRMHSAEDVELIMTDMVVKAKTKLRGVPAKIAATLLAQSEITALETILASEIDECLMEIAEYSPEMFKSTQKGDADE